MHGREITPSPSEHPAEQNGFMTHASMYEIAGQGPLTERSVKRYLKDKEQDEEIQKLAQASSAIDQRIAEFDHKLLEASQNELTDLILRGLEQADPALQQIAAHMMWKAPVNELPFLFDKCLHHPNPDVARIAASDMKDAFHFGNISADHFTAFIEPCLASHNARVIEPVLYVISHLHTETLGKQIHKHLLDMLDGEDHEAQETAVRMIWWAPESERTTLIEKCLEHPNPEVQRAAAWKIEWLPADQRAAHIERCLEHPNPQVQSIATASLRHVPFRKREALREKILNAILAGLQSGNSEAQEMAAVMIEAAPVDQRIALWKLCLECPNPLVQPIGLEWIKAAPEDERGDLIETYLSHPNPEVQSHVVNFIPFAPEEQHASLIKKCLEHSNLNAQVSAMEHIGIVRGPDRVALLTQALQSQHTEVQLAAMDKIRLAPEQDRSALREMAIQKLGDRIVEPPLYKPETFANDSRLFPRQSFHKTGSETTLVGGELRGKVIVRHITPEAFLAWQALYEDFALWKEADFDYVPIEPIVSYQLNKDGVVDVTSSVLDLNLYEWKKRDESYTSELEIDRARILTVLGQQKVSHGHAHDANFCLRFFRDKNGHVDFKRKPRLYLIDFDQAISP